MDTKSETSVMRQWKASVHSGMMRRNIKSTKKRKAARPLVIPATVMLQHSSFQVMRWKESNRGPPFFLGLQWRKLQMALLGWRKPTGGRIGAQDSLVTKDVQRLVRKQL